jgi:hypothetical protein
MNACRFRAFASALLVPLTLSVVYADVTVRYKMEVKMNPALPAGMAAGVMKALPQESVLRLKGGKGWSSAALGYDSIVDFTTREITLLDAAGKRYAKTTYDRFSEEMAAAMPEMPAQARGAAASMKTDVSPAKLTGRTTVIQGVEAEEREIVVSVEGPPTQNMPPGPTVRMLMQFWTAKAGEVMRVPAIRELTGYSLWSYATMNPAAAMGKMMKQFPGSDAFEPLMKEMQQGTTVLRIHMDVFMPTMAAMLQRVPAGNRSIHAIDPSTPFMQMDQEVAEISTAPVPDRVFQIPEGFQEAAASELIKGMVAKSRAAAR